MRKSILFVIIAIIPSVLPSQLTFSDKIIIQKTDTDYPTSVYAADLDGDKNLDVLSASYEDSKIAWYKNKGNGFFGEQRVISSLACGATSVCASDLDGDGDMDVISSSLGFEFPPPCYGNIAWYENDGHGSFSEQKIVMERSGENVFVTDLDGDGYKDILTCGGDGYYSRISWCKNDGHGNFGEENYIVNVDYRVSCVCAFDLDGDNDMDILSSSERDEEIAWYKNEGTGTFSSALFIDSLENLSSVYAADMDSDGDNDVIAVSDGRYSDYIGQIICYMNDGIGNFQKKIVSTSVYGAVSVYATNLDDDIDIDILYAGGNNHIVAWYENDSTSTSNEKIITTEAVYPASVFAADLDSDGDNDVLCASMEDNKITYYLNNGTGTFSKQYMITTSLRTAMEVHSADLNGDGNMDVIATGAEWDLVVWYENDSTGNFSQQRIINFKPTWRFAFASSVLSYDLNRDGNIDLLVSFYGSDSSRIVWFKNDGLGYFSLQKIVSIPNPKTIPIYGADLDGDIDIDILSSINNRIVWFQNDGSGDFSSEKTICSTKAGSIHAGDLDADGDIDVLANVGSTWGYYISWFENDGKGNFTVQRDIGSSVAAETFYVNAVDMDNDEDLDILWSREWEIRCFNNEGSANFNSTWSINRSTNGVSAIQTTDLDSDGDIDVLGTSDLDNIIVWYENQARHAFSNKIIIAELEDPYSVYPADLDGDGDMDVLSVSPLSNSELVWYRNQLVDTHIEDNESYTPLTFQLLQNYPNPFNPQTEIRYNLDRSGPVSLKVFDIVGREVTTLVQEVQSAGSYNITFDGAGLPSGIFFYQLRCGTEVQVKKMLLLQ